MTTTTVSRDVAHKFFHFLNERKVAYVIIGDPAVFMDRGKDWDLFVGSYDEFLSALRDFCTLENISIVNHFPHATGIKFYLGVPIENGERKIISGPDVLFFSTGYIKGDVGLSVDRLMKSRRLDSSGYAVPSSKEAFIFFLVKKIDKGNLGDRHIEYLSKLMTEDPEGIKQAIKKMWPLRYVNLLIEASESGRWDPVIDIQQELRNQLRKKSSFSFRRIAWIVRRMFLRSFDPAGLHIVLLGPDGSGKSSVTERVMPSLARAFFGTTYIHGVPHWLNAGGHWRRITGAAQRFFNFQPSPKKGNGSTRPTTGPHRFADRSLLTSMFKLLNYALDNIVGWAVFVWPQKIQAKLFVFDRYYYDILVDPKRLRYGGPSGPARWVGTFIVKPDVLIILDVPPEVVQQRKQDVSYEESGRQREEYQKLAKSLNHATVIDASQSLEKVVADVNKTVLDFMAQRTEKRMDEWNIGTST